MTVPRKNPPREAASRKVHPSHAINQASIYGSCLKPDGSEKSKTKGKSKSQQKRQLRARARRRLARRRWQDTVSDTDSETGSKQKRRIPGEKALVPDIGRIIYDTLSHRKMKPGEPIPEPPDDLQWAIPKHQQTFQDSNIADGVEEQYRREFDVYILKHRITNALFFPPAWLGFVEAKASWLAADKALMIEFGKHLNILLLIDALTREHVAEGMGMINKARAEIRRKAKEKEDEEEGGGDKEDKERKDMEKDYDTLNEDRTMADAEAAAQDSEREVYSAPNKRAGTERAPYWANRRLTPISDSEGESLSSFGEQ